MRVLPVRKVCKMGYAGITREEGLQNGQSVRKVSCQHILHNVT